MKTRKERISEVALLPSRSDWREVVKKVGELVPGMALVIQPPDDADFNKFRSAILTASRRLEFEPGWRVRTRTVRRKRELHCYLAPE